MNRKSLNRFVILIFAPILAAAQPASPVCSATAVPSVLRAEGVAERAGDIVLNCTGAPGSEVTGNLSVFLSTSVTNRVSDSSGALDVALTLNGSLAGVNAVAGGNNQVLFPGLRVVLNPAGAAEVRISNLRVDASFGGSALTERPAGAPFLPIQPVVAQLSFTPGTSGLVSVQPSQLVVAVPERGLYATTLSTLIPCQTGSPVPSPLTFSEALRIGTFFSSTRITEGTLDAFDRAGTRVMLRFTGFDSGARLFVPAGIAGSNAAVPTRGGDFGGSASPGQYANGSGTLFLRRMLATDAHGASGQPVPVTLPELESLSEVTLVNGSGIAVYEVVDANGQVRESAQIPVFVAVPRDPQAENTSGGLTVSFGPVSNTFTTSATAPVPRFLGVAAPVDCTILGDCETYIPKLGAQPANMQFRLVRGVGHQLRSIALSNTGGGSLMPWNATVEYKRGNGWIRLDRNSALEPVLVRVQVTALPAMEAGLYEATLTIDAGIAGVARYPVRLEVVEGTTSPPPPAENPNRPRIASVVQGATFQPGPVARGSLITLRGANLAGRNVAVTFDGTPAVLLYTGVDQINVRVPAELPGNTAQLVVTIDGVASAPVTVDVVAANPGIFTPGILNQDGSVNTASNPAPTGSVVQIFATGLLTPDASGTVEATLHGYSFAALPYAGPAPGIAGVQQVNLHIPEGWPTMTTEVFLCTSAGGSRQCSAPVKIHMRSAQ